MRHKRKSYRDYDDDEDEVSKHLAAVNERLDDLTREIGRMARHAPGEADEPRRLVDAIAKLDRRLDQITAETRAAPSDSGRREAPARMPGASTPNWAAEISARQRALDGHPAAAAAPARHAPAHSPRQDLSGLEQQLRHITTQIAELHRPEDVAGALAELRRDLASIGRALTEALPQQAIETLETEIRTLADRLDRTRSSGSGGDASTLSNLEHGLAEIRDSLRSLTPAEGLVGVDEAVRGLSRKIDQMAVGTQDPAVFQQLDHAITSLHGIVSNVASDGALAQLAAEVHGLASKFERTANAGSADALAKLDERIAALMDSGRGAPPELESSIRTLSERLERSQLSQSDQLVLGSLEDRIVKLFEKLDAADSRLGSLGAIERGVADLLVHVEEIRAGNGQTRGPRAPASAPAKAEPEPAAAPRTPPPQLMIQAPQPEPAAAAAPEPAPAPPKAMPPRARECRPIDPNLPPDTPLEPGSGTPRVKPGSPAARIAASEAALGGARPAIAEAGGKSATVAAARSAAKSANAEAPAAIAPKAKAKKPKSAEEWASLEEYTMEAAPRTPLFSGLTKHIKTVLIAASVVAIVLLAAQTAWNLLFPDEAPEAPPAGTDPLTTQQIGRTSSFFDPKTILPQELPLADITGSVSRQPQPPRTAPTAAAPVDPAIAALPPSIGLALRTAAAAGDPAAEYEIAIRLADGRGVTQNLEETARWLERAAKTGFAPAQFRLASQYEKGEGIKKDLGTARRLYVAAAEKGHAKAMHNLAVLYAEGIDGKPDYKTAAQWFRKAASYGIADSQFNLAILYARGIGPEQNLSESYKWFALAAGKGDKDAAKKRDEVAARLDQQTLMAAKLAAQTFTPDQEPEEATSLKAPPGGWDRASVATRPIKRSSGSPLPLRNE